MRLNIVILVLLIIAGVGGALWFMKSSQQAQADFQAQIQSLNQNNAQTASVQAAQINKLKMTNEKITSENMDLTNKLQALTQQQEVAMAEMTKKNNMLMQANQALKESSAQSAQKVKVLGDDLQKIQIAQAALKKQYADAVAKCKAPAAVVASKSAAAGATTTAANTAATPAPVPDQGAHGVSLTFPTPAAAK